MSNVARVLANYGFVDQVDGSFVRLCSGREMNHEKFKAAVLFVSDASSFCYVRPMYGYKRVVRGRRTWYEIRRFDFGREEQGFTF